MKENTLLIFCFVLFCMQLFTCYNIQNIEWDVRSNKQQNSWNERDITHLEDRIRLFCK